MDYDQAVFDEMNQYILEGDQAICPRCGNLLKVDRDQGEALYVWVCDVCGFWDYY